MKKEEDSLSRSLAKVFARTERRQGEANRPMELPLDAIDPPATNPRQVFDQQALEELADSIRRYGLLQPILVLRHGERYEVLAGERRYRACLLIGLERVPVVVRDEDDDRVIAELRLIENLQRENLNPIELAVAYQHLIEDHGLSQEQLAERMGKSRPSISNTLRLLSLPRDLQMHLVTGAIGMGHVKPLIGLPADVARNLAKQIIEDGLTVREVERRSKRVRDLDGDRTSGSSSSSARRSSKPVHVRELEQNLGRLLDADVVVNERQGAGSLTVHFHSKGHFKAVVDQLEQAFREARREGQP